MLKQFIQPNSLPSSAVSQSEIETVSDAPASLARLRCPRCRGLLADPHGLGLCPDCGYCRSLVETASQEDPSKSEGSPGGFGRVLGVLPLWVWLVVVPVGAVLPVCLAADRELPAGSPLRVIWGAAQLALGLLTLFAGQAWALLILRRHREAVEPLDVLSPFKVWSRAFRWLPQTSGALALASGGLTAVLATLLWVDDFSSWLARAESARKERRVAQNPRSQAEREEEGQKGAERLRVWELKAKKGQQPGSEGTSPVKPAGTSPSTADAGRQPASRKVAHCVIIGYVLRGDGRIASLVLATRKGDRLIGAGVVAPVLSAERRAKLLARLADQHRAEPVVEGPTRVAVWVNPVVLCEVWCSGADAGGTLIEPALKDIAEE